MRAVVAVALLCGVVILGSPTRAGTAGRASAGDSTCRPGSDWRVAVSRDRSTIAWTREGATNRLLVANADGSGAHDVLSARRSTWWVDAIAPDGAEVLAADEPYGAEHYVLVQTNGSGSHPVTPDERTALRREWRTPEWSPDGRLRLDVETLAGAVVVERFDGSGRRRVAAKEFPHEAAWSPDGRWIAFTADDFYNSLDELYVVRPDGTGLHEIQTRSDGVSSISWSRDSQHLAYELDWSAYKSGVVIGVASPDGNAKQLTSSRNGADDRAAEFPAWLDDDTLIFTTRPRVNPITIGLNRIEVDGTAERRVTYHCHLGTAHADWNFHGSQLADVIRTFGARDVVFAHRGDDEIDPGPGPDRVDAGPGDDAIWTRDGSRDVILGGPGHDSAVVDHADVVRGVETVRRR